MGILLVIDISSLRQLFRLFFKYYIDFCVEHKSIGSREKEIILIVTILFPFTLPFLHFLPLPHHFPTRDSGNMYIYVKIHATICANKCIYVS